MQIRMRRQSAVPTTSGTEKARIRSRRQSAPPQLRTDIEKLRKKLTKLRETSSLKGEILKEEEISDDENAPEKSILPPPGKVQQTFTQLPEPYRLLDQEKMGQVRKESCSEPTSPVVKSVTELQQVQLASNTGYRGSVVFIDDDDKH
ncbi:unnamed protein product [Gongylonema pulchrum]|uniref:Uncharacterized protein n=1 Tax=Gongylonema pulchrum TaxID=637853 RepID=A0A183EEG2_9BILA|nr:unnamed protein product [Gongylonema pulchrum]